MTATVLPRTRDPASPASSLPAPLATWRTRHPLVWGVALSVGGLLLTAAGAGFAQGAGLAGATHIWVIAGFVAVSGALGVLAMTRTRHSLADYGFRRPVELRRIGHGVPLLLIPPIVAVTAGITVTPAEALAYAALTVAVGINEEAWFRGLVQAALRGLGERRAVVAGAVIFGVLHLVNAAGGKDALYLGLQAVFAAEVGFALAAIVVITRSLWVGIAWHFVYDFTAYCTGDGLGGNALIGVAIMMVLLAGYSVWLWSRLPSPRRTESVAR